MLSLLLIALTGNDVLAFPPEVRRLTVPQRPALEAHFGVGLDVADTDGDGFDDLVVGAPSMTIGWEGNAGAVFVLRGPSLTFVDRLTEDPVDDFHYFGDDVVAGDMDGDSLAEIAVSWMFGGEVRRGTNHEEVLGLITGGSAADNHLLFVDVDRDGREDLVEARLFSPRELTIFYGPDMQRVDHVIPQNPPVDFYPYNLSAGDIDGDGFVDLVTGAPGTSNVAPQEGVAWCFFGPDFSRYRVIEDPTPLEEGNFARGTAVGDYDQDGFADVATTSKAELCDEAYRCGEAFVFFGPDFARSHRFHDPFPGEDEVAGTHRVATADIDDNGIDDLVISRASGRVQGLQTGDLWIFYGPDFAVWERVVPKDVWLGDTAALFGRLIRVGDVTGDGLDDLVVNAPNADSYQHGQGGMVHIFDFSTRFPFRSYGVCSGQGLTLAGEGNGVADGTSRLVVEGLDGGDVYLLLGRQACSEAFSGPGTKRGCDKRLLVVPRRYIDLGPAAGTLEYILRLPKDAGLDEPGVRYRFQVLEAKNDGFRVSNGVVWTVRGG